MNEHYELTRIPITADRWEKVYGWSREKAEQMDGLNTEVRLHHVSPDGTRRDLAPDRDGGFEWGYGGTGPHESAAAIVGDLTQTVFNGHWRENLTPANLQEWVPEVFDGDLRERENVIVYPTDVRMRMGLTPEPDDD